MAFDPPRRRSIKAAFSDGAAALAAARNRAPGLPLFVLGQGVGGAVALGALEREGGVGVRGVVLDSCFASFRGVARDRFARSRFARPIRGLLAVLLYSDHDKPSRLAARRAPIPLVVMHSPADPVVSYQQGRFLYEAAKGPKEWWEVSGTGHADAFTRQAADLRPRLLRFLNSHL